MRRLQKDAFESKQKYSIARKTPFTHISLVNFVFVLNGNISRFIMKEIITIQ